MSIKILVSSATMIVVLVAGFFAYRAQSVQAVRKPGSGAEKQAKLAAARASWSAYSFDPIKGSVHLDTTLKNAISVANKALGSERLEPEQETRALAAVRLFYHGYNSEDFDEFLQFRRPVAEYTHSSPRAQWIRQNLVRHGKLLVTDIPESDDALFEYCWRKDLWCGKSFLQGVALETIRISFSHSTELPNAKDIFALLPRVPVAGSISYYPFFIFPDQPKKVAPDGKVFLQSARSEPATASSYMTMTIACVVQPRAPDFPMPVAYKVYWSKRFDQWLPMGFAAGCTYQRKWDPLF